MRLSFWLRSILQACWIQFSTLHINRVAIHKLGKTLIGLAYKHKFLTPLPTGQDGVENRDKVY